MDRADGFDPQRIVWRMVDQPLLFPFYEHEMRTPHIGTTNALALIAWLHADRTAL